MPVGGAGLVSKTGMNAAHVDDVIVGCVSQTGGQAGNIGRSVFKV